MKRIIKILFVLYFIIGFNFQANATLAIHHPSLEQDLLLKNDDLKFQSCDNLTLVKTELVEIKITNYEITENGSFLITGLLIHTTLYGDLTLKREFQNNALIIDIITNPYFLRLFRINQYGLSVFSKHSKDLFKDKSFHKYTRGDHSINMAMILVNFNRPIYEIICALLHDFTHTLLSHLGDSLLRLLIEQNYNDEIIKQISDLILSSKEQKTAIQDMIFEWYFEITGITKILNEYGIELSKILLENNPVIKRPAPLLCADNLEYTLTGAFLAGIITKEIIDDITKHLNITEDNYWIFKKYKKNEDDTTCIYMATILFNTSMELDKKNSAAPWNAIMNYYGAILFQKALNIGIITVENLILDTETSDDMLWTKIKSSKDLDIKDLRNKVKKPSKVFRFLKKQTKTSFKITTKTRIIDPKIELENGEINLLSELNFKITKILKNYNFIMCKQGHCVKFFSNDYLPEKKLIEGY
ncbi:MAG: metal dependent phosphohydrolase [candidate division TM6 bacterium GW2011_GWF2_28_16]|nr:MAG: metal dependent phosphohydrolase [candidate division TM6 bacterium GW2011_GWF2_28_16]